MNTFVMLSRSIPVVLAIELTVGLSAFAATICPAASTISGVDVSDDQGAVDFDEAKAANVQFAFIKATEGASLRMADFARDWAAAKAAGVIRSAYHFFRPADDPTEQASEFLGAMGELQEGDLPPMLDMEEINGVSPATIIARARVWLERVEQATGKAPIVYTSIGYWEGMGNTPGFDHYPLFVADYDVQCPKVPAPWTHYMFWQKGSGRDRGVATAVDQDIFNGGLASLQAMTLGN